MEREQRIQQELEKESEISRLKLAQATEQLREKQSFRGREQHQEHTHVLHQQIEDDAAAIERDEVRLSRITTRMHATCDKISLFTEINFCSLHLFM